MRLLVGLAVVRAGKGLSTEATLEWLLSRVTEAVPLQMAALGKGLWTQVALKRTLGVVVPRPCPKQSQTTERCLAHMGTSWWKLLARRTAPKGGTNSLSQPGTGTIAVPPMQSVVLRATGCGTWSVSNDC